MKENESKIAFIFFHLFFRIWPFQWVMADSNKKVPLRFGSRPGLWVSVSRRLISRSRRASARGLVSIIGIFITHISDFFKASHENRPRWSRAPLA
jgi:hypothetical protein